MENLSIYHRITHIAYLMMEMEISIFIKRTSSKTNKNNDELSHPECHTYLDNNSMVLHY